MTTERAPVRLACVGPGRVAVYEGRKRVAHFTTDPPGIWIDAEQIEQVRTAYYEVQARR